LRSSRSPLLGLGIGLVLAGILAAVLFGGIGVGGGTPPVAQQVEAANLQPGINGPTGLLLSLTVFPANVHKQAPNFHLTDQDGQPVSMNQFRGKVVILAANDDRCTDLCTLLANDIVAANRDLGAAARDVVWLSVNANPYYPSVASVRAWTDQHGLGDQPNWRFGTAAPATLEQVWRDYGIAVQEDPKTRTVAHSTELFFVSPDGQERAVAEFGTAAANTALFAHGMAQMADDLLPAGERVHVAGPEVPAPSATNATVGAIAPDFDLPYLGRAGRLRLAALRGHYTVVNFWSSTCTACRSELPGLETAYRAERGKVDFVGVDVADRSAPARALAAQAHLSYPLVADANGTAAGAEQITGLPYTLILAPNGQILIRHPGALTTEQLEYVLASEDPALPTS
jgi:cytochrome oxidase Cu insertion factor (SCO1/SenC/PrrC family)/thiol-disulfide isomerase/thioredoxin